MSGSTEHQLGKGTLGYKGETAQYYASKRGLWDRFRWVLAAACLVIGAAFLIASFSPSVTVRVVSVTANVPSENDFSSAPTNSVVLVAPDGSTTTLSVPSISTPAVGSTQQAMRLPGGRRVLGDYTNEGRGAALIFLATGAGIVLMAVWRIRRPTPLTTTVLVPDDTYALPPRMS